jgi:hypothetical protein
MIDQEKMTKALQKRANQAKDLAKQYTDAYDPMSAARYKERAVVYEEIITDINRKKFNVKN